MVEGRFAYVVEVASSRISTGPVLPRPATPAT